VQPLDRRGDGQHGAVGLRGLVPLALALEQVGPQDERQQVHGVERERAGDRRLLGRRVAACTARHGLAQALLEIHRGYLSMRKKNGPASRLARGAMFLLLFRSVI
jgi:hypothetical protein